MKATELFNFFSNRKKLKNKIINITWYWGGAKA